MFYIIVFIVIQSMVCNAGMADGIEYLGSTASPTKDLVLYKDTLASNKTYLYAAQGVTIAVYDVTTATKPVLLNRIMASTDSVYDLKIWKDRLYAARGGAGIGIYDLNEPKHPQLIINLPYVADEVWVGDLVLMAVNRSPVSTGGGSASRVYEHKVYDISDFNNPIERGRRYVSGSSSYMEPTFWWAEVLPEQKATAFYYSHMISLDREIIKTKEAYSPYQVQQPLIRFAHGSTITRHTVGLVFHEGLAFILFDEGLEVHDFDNESTLKARMPFEKPYGIHKDNERIYLQSKDKSVYELIHDDLKNLSASEPVDFPFFIDEIFEGVAYGALGREGLAIQPIHYATEEEAIYLKQPAHEIVRIQGEGNVLIAENMYQDRETHEMLSTELLMVYKDGEFEVSHDVFDSLVSPAFGLRMRIDDVMAVAAAKGIQLYDFSNPHNPRPAGFLDEFPSRKWNSVRFMTTVDNYLHISYESQDEEKRGWYVYSIDSLDKPHLLKKYDYIELFDFRTFIVNNMMYVMKRIRESDNFRSTIRMFKLSDGSSIQSAGQIELDSRYGEAQGFAINQDLFVIFDADCSRYKGILQIYRMRGQTEAECVSEVELPVDLTHIYLNGTDLWCLQHREGCMGRNKRVWVYLIDLSNPCQPEIVDRINVGLKRYNEMMRFYNIDDLIVLPGNEEGLHMMRRQ